MLKGEIRVATEKKKCTDEATTITVGKDATSCEVRKERRV